MKDGIIKADGTSRLMRATLPATYEAFRAAAAAGTLPLDVLFNESGWSQQPTFLNKANLLTDATAALFGLGTEAVPDNAFSFLGKYNQHWWRRRQKGAHYELKEENLTGCLYDNNRNVVYTYSDSVTVSDSGEVVLDGQTSTKNFETVYDAESFFPNLLGKYFTVSQYVGNPYNSAFALTAGNVYYVRPDSTCTIDWDGPYLVGVKLSRYSAEYVTDMGDWNYLQSADRNTYPDSGIVDSYEYEYLGVPFENAVTAPQIQKGSYVGTGTYGANNPCSLTFGFAPEYVFIFSLGLTTIIQPYGYRLYNFHNNKQEAASFDGNTVSWWSPTQNATYQLNETGKTYYYVAVG